MINWNGMVSARVLSPRSEQTVPQRVLKGGIIIAFGSDYLFFLYLDTVKNVTMDITMVSGKIV
ncbi:MAG: hypothetical protein QGF78_00780 [Candidatus Bathyarchaeota archaeon]|nr:hypothetical protein [Candidatus Bathyarchaeota archaeon]